MKTIDFVKKMWSPVAIVVLGLVGLYGFIWMLPLAIGIAASRALWILAKDREDKQILEGLSRTFFCSALAVGAFGFIVTYLTL